MLVRARPPHNVCVCMFVCMGGNEVVALHAGQALLLLLLLLLPWLLPSSYACAARPSSVASAVNEDGCASWAVAHVRCNLQGVGLLIAGHMADGGSGGLVVLAPIKGGPADRAGVLPGDEVSPPA